MSPDASQSNLSISDALRRDLALVLPGFEQRLNRPALASVEGEADKLAARIDACRAPAFTGLHELSIEAVRWVVALAERTRGKLLPLSTSLGLSPDTQPVTQTATLGHIFASDLIIWIGCTGTDSPITQRIAERQLRAAFVDATLPAVQQLRAEMLAQPESVPGNAKRIGVVLAPDCDTRVASQWHKLAADLQQRTRMAVIRLPDLATRKNTRGALETITWQTGLSCAMNGIDFSDGAPRPCADDAARLAADGLDQPFAFPPLEVPSAARVMRFDGIVLWLCDDPATAPPDYSAALIEAVCKRVRRRT